jgi:hypothetical protein
MNGYTLKGEAVRRSIPVCGPAAFVVLKSFAFADRGEPKDAYDLVYVLRRWPGGASDIAYRLASHATKHTVIVEDALGKLANDFATTAHHGPRRPQHSKEAEPKISTRQQPTPTATSTTCCAHAAHKSSTSARNFREPVLRRNSRLGADLAFRVR